MSEDLSKAAGRGVEVEIDGKKWTVSPLTMGDLADFQSHVRGQRLATLREHLAGLSEEQQRDLILAVINTPVDGDEMDREMATFAGFRFLLWKSLGKAHTDLELDAVGQMLDAKAIAELLAVIQGISGIGEDENAPVAGQSATP